MVCKTKKAAKQSAASSLLEVLLPIMRRGVGASKSEMVDLFQATASAADRNEASSIASEIQRPTSSSKETQLPSKRSARSQHPKPLPPQQRPLKSSHQNSKPTLPLPLPLTSIPIATTAAPNSYPSLVDNLHGRLAKRPFSMVVTQEDSDAAHMLLNPSRRLVNLSLSGGESGNEGEEGLKGPWGQKGEDGSQKRQNHVLNQEGGIPYPQSSGHLADRGLFDHMANHHEGPSRMDVGHMLDDVRKLLQGAGIKQTSRS